MRKEYESDHDWGRKIHTAGIADKGRSTRVCNRCGLSQLYAQHFFIEECPGHPLSDEAQLDILDHEERSDRDED